METLFNVPRLHVTNSSHWLWDVVDMKFTPSTRTLAILFLAILVVSVVNSYLIIDNKNAIIDNKNAIIDNNNAIIDNKNAIIDNKNAIIDNKNAIINNNNDLQKQRNQDVSNFNQSLNQTYSSLNQTDTALNQTTYAMQDLLNRKIDNLNALLPIEQYDYVIYRYWDYNSNVSIYMLKNGRNGTVEYNSTDASSVFNRAFNNGNSVFVKSDEYTLNSDVYVANKKNARLDSDGATLNMNGTKIIVSGTDYTHSQNNQVSGFVIVNGTVRIQNSFGTTVTDMIFQNSKVGLELANTNNWTEGTRIDTIHFDKCTQGLVFRTNTSSILSQGNTTGSYANTEVNRCYFNQLDNSIAITVERQAEFTDSQMQDVRIWIGEFGKYNQTGLQLDGSMYKTLMNGVVFESFAPQPLNDAYLYAMKIGATAYQSPVLGSGVNILGIWTARIFNPNSIWIFGVGGVFEQTNIAIPVGSNSYGNVQVIQVHPATIASFKPKITVQGSFDNNETVTVRLRLEFVDNVVSNNVEKSFNSSGSVWLGDDDFLQLYAYPDVIYAILVDAKVSPPATDAKVQIDLYGTTT
jgi:hypothetical protein